MEYEEFVANQDMDRLSHFLRSDFDSQNYDYIYTFGTSASKRVHLTLEGKTPQIFTVVSFPVESGLVQSLEEPGTNCTGATHIVPLELQIQTALKLFEFKTLLMLFNPRELNSKLSREQIAELSKKYQFGFTSLRSVSETTLQEALGKIRSGEVTADIVYLPSDSMITTNMDYIVKELIDMKQLHFTAFKKEMWKAAHCWGWPMTITKPEKRRRVSCRPESERDAN